MVKGHSNQYDLILTNYACKDSCFPGRSQSEVSGGQALGDTLQPGLESKPFPDHTLSSTVLDDSSLCRVNRVGVEVAGRVPVGLAGVENT